MDETRGHPPDGLDQDGVTTDQSLIRRVHAGESAAATTLYDRYAARLFSLARANTGADLSSRFDPEDILQSVFRTFFRRVERGDYDLLDDESLWKLLLVITLNKLRSKGSHHRAEKRDVRHTKDGAIADFALQTIQASDEIALADLRMAVDELLSSLPESQRMILELRMQGDKVVEIAAKTGRSKRTVERAIQDFSAQMRRQIEMETGS